MTKRELQQQVTSCALNSTNTTTTSLHDLGVQMLVRILADSFHGPTQSQKWLNITDHACQSNIDFIISWFS